MSEKRLLFTKNGNVRYRLKTSYGDGTTYVIFELLDFIARLAALVPKLRVNLLPWRVCAERPAPRPGDAGAVLPLGSGYAGVRRRLVRPSPVRPKPRSARVAGSGIEAAST